MKTTERFDNAVSKLYTAFWNGTLDAMDCTHCAVGNLCDNSKAWVGYYEFGHKDRIIETYKNVTGYSNMELATIELVFIEGNTVPDEMPKFTNAISEEEVLNGKFTREEQRDLQFKGLCAVVEYLCELDNIPNVMDYTKLFESENNEPKYQLS